MLRLCMSEKKNLSPEVWENNFYPNQITHTPLKSQIIARLLIQPSVLAPRQCGHFDRRKVPGGEERGEVDVLAG